MTSGLSLAGTGLSVTGTASAATNLAGGTANQIPYQTAPSTTSFIVAPTTANTALTWTGSAFAWANAPLAVGTTAIGSGAGSGSVLIDVAGVLRESTLQLGTTANKPTFGIGGAAYGAIDTGGNVGLGQSANAAITTGTGNVSFSTLANRAVTSGNDNVALGAQTLRSLSTGSRNFAAVNSAGFNLTTGTDNFFALNQAGLNATTAFGQILIGFQAGSNVVSNAGANETDPSVIIGYNAGKWCGSTGDGGNVIIGVNAGGPAAGGTAGVSFYRLTAVGHNAGTSITAGPHNTLIGDAAGFSLTIGGSNVYVGRGSGRSNVSGGFNTGVGHAAGTLFTSGDNNTHIGNGAGNAGDIGIPRTGSFNTAVGEVAGTLGAADSNSITIGANTTVNGSNLTAIGIGQTAAYISGRLAWTVTDSAISNAAGVTYTASQFLGGIITRSGAVAVSDATPSAAAIVAGIPGCEVGSTAFLYIVNNNLGLLTITAGSGVTLAGTTTAATLFTRLYAIEVTNATASTEAVTLKGVFTAAN